jgi:conjugal transfer ATP-binding protein TraC
MSSLAEKLEVWGFEEGKIIFKDLSLGAVLEIEPRDISCFTDEELNSLHAITCDFLNGLPVGLNLQFVQGIHRGGAQVAEKHKALACGEAQPLVQKLLHERTQRILKLDEQGNTPKQSLYLVLRKAFAQKPKPKKNFKFWEKKAPDSDFSRDVINPELRIFEQIVREVQQGLENLGLTSKPLNEEKVFNLLFDQWNPGHPLEGLNFNHEDIRDDLLLNDMVMSVKGFALGAVHHRVLSLKIMPDQTFASMSEKFRDLPFDSKLFLSIAVLNQELETMALQTQRRIAYAMYSGKKGVSDLESEAKLRDIEALLSGRVAGQEKIFSASLSIVLRDEDESVLEDQVSKVLQTVRELSGAEGMVESLAAGTIFMETALPNAKSLERARRMNTSVLSDFLPIYGDWVGHEEPRVLLRNRRGSLIGFDPFSPRLTNFNQIVSGGSGAGKSFLTNILLAHVMKENPKIFILDIGGSYRKLAENLEGQYIPLGADSEIALNPFDLVDSSPEALDQKIKFMTSLVEMMTKEDESSGIGKLERSEIEQTIKDVLREEEEPRLSHLRDRLLKNSEPALHRMGKILGPWCGDSPFGKFVDRKTNLELQSRIVCFDLKGLEALPELQAVCLFLITDLIWREVQRDRISQKFVIFDECWKLIESGAGSRFIGEVFRTFRKYRASAIAISQTMDDFSKSKIASAIMPNSSVKWILKQTGGNIPSLKETLLLNERETKLVESITSKKGYFSEAFLIAGDEKQVVVVESTPLEYWLATTDPQDLKAFEDLRQKNPNASDGELLEVLGQKFPRGASAL